jgi:hypothetical protein
LVVLTVTSELAERTTEIAELRAELLRLRALITEALAYLDQDGDSVDLVAAARRRGFLLHEAREDLASARDEVNTLTQLLVVARESLADRDRELQRMPLLVAEMVRARAQEDALRAEVEDLRARVEGRAR